MIEPECGSDGMPKNPGPNSMGANTQAAENNPDAFHAWRDTSDAEWEKMSVAAIFYALEG